VQRGRQSKLVSVTACKEGRRKNCRLLACL
jgi:hypothetical protein